MFQLVIDCTSIRIRGTYGPDRTRIVQILIWLKVYICTHTVRTVRVLHVQILIWSGTNLLLFC